jgi:hypothetical protein
VKSWNSLVSSFTPHSSFSSWIDLEVHKAYVSMKNPLFLLFFYAELSRRRESISALHKGADHYSADVRIH